LAEKRRLHQSHTCYQVKTFGKLSAAAASVVSEEAKGSPFVHVRVMCFFPPSMVKFMIVQVHIWC
jgi:hypothetical protein